WPTRRGFDRFYGEHSYVDSYFYPTNQLYLDEEPIEPEGDNWYSTDAYTDYAIRFINNAQGRKPYFLYLAYNAPHFPLQAFREDMEKYGEIYKQGWDVIRRQRYDRQKTRGIIEPDWRLPPRNPGAEGWHEPVPAWQDEKEKNLWEMKMAAYAAQIDRMDQNIGRLLETLRARNELENTLIIFLSDNGGCAEDWINERNPDGVRPGARKCRLAYGLPWAQVSNTPFRLFKRWVHEGGIATPGIVHWPDGLEYRGISHEMSHVIDVMPTLLEIAGLEYPEFFHGNTITPPEGKSLVPIFRTGSRTGHQTMGWEHEGNRAFRKGHWKLVWRGRFREGPWELYNLADDRTEMNNLANEYPEKVNELKAGYNAWAERVGVTEWDTLTDNNQEG
ncbi:MAG TPA: sulfatase-like hydrolase/transferase, partial [bacterium]|nr:sulfatase-like hydrolase/transferase [bacterium]